MTGEDRPVDTDTRSRIEKKESELAHPLKRLSPHAAHALAAGTRVRTFLVDVQGLSPETISALLPVVRADLDDRNLVPILVTDLLDYRVFREARVIFEAVPPVADSARLAPDLDWERRRSEVMELIRDKWRPVGETKLGTEAI